MTTYRDIEREPLMEDKLPEGKQEIVAEAEGETFIAESVTESVAAFPAGQGGANAEPFEELAEQERGADKASDRVDRLLKERGALKPPDGADVLTDTHTD